MIKDSYGNARFYGVYRGTVFDTRDPQNLGRIQVKIPQILANQSTQWAWPVEKYDTTTKVPAVGQGVWVMFEGGDPSYPIWMGTFGSNSGVVIEEQPSSPVVPEVDTTTNYPAAVRWSPKFEATGLTFTGSNTTYPTYNSYYVKYGQLITFNIKVDLTTVTNFGTGQFKLELPFDPIPSAANHFIAWSWVDPSQPPDELNGHKQLIADHLPGSKVLDLHWLKETTASPKPLIESILVQGTPVTFTTASIMYVNGTYIADEVI